MADQAFRRMCVLALLLLLALGPAVALAEEKAKETQPRPESVAEKKDAPGTASQSAASSQPAAQTQPVTYRPPQRGAPGGRVGGGTRGSDPNLIALFVLAPDHVALTTRETPDFYWYISASPKYPVEFTFTEDQGVEPLVQTRIPPPVKAGLNKISLKDYGVKLSKGVQYRWFIALVADENRRSKDLVAGAMIECVDTPAGLKERLVKSAPGAEWSSYAQEGVWYDTIMVLSEEIAARPGDLGLRAQRDNLLDQVGLPKIGDMR